MSLYELRCSIGGKPVYDAPRGDAQSNWFECGQGAHPGQGRVLVARRDWEAISTATSTSLKIWQRKDGADWPATPTLELPVRIHAALPFVQPKTVGATEGEFLELHLTDMRYAWSQASEVTAAFNVQLAGFPHVGGVPTFYEATLSSGSEKTWASVAAALGLETTGFTFPTVNPRNLVLSGCTLSEAIDRVLGILHAGASFDWSTGLGRIVALDSSLTSNATMWTDFQKTPLMRSLASASDLRYPATVTFRFRVAGTGTDPFETSRRWYDKSIASGYGVAGSKRVISVGYWYGQDAGGSIANSAELDTVATFLNGRNVIDRYAEVGDVRNVGIVPFVPDGKLRRVLWTFDAHEITTTVRVNSDVPIRAASRAHESVRPSHVADGVGAAIVTPTIDGRTHMDAGAAATEFDAIIVGNQIRADNKWRYAWVSAVLQGDDYVRQDPPELSGTTASDYAINGDETGNTAAYMACGVRLDGPDFPAGMRVIPVGSDYEENLYDVHVRMRRTVDETGAVRYAFNRQNQIDGPCEE